MALEDKLEYQGKSEQPNIWDSLVAAYSSSRAVKIGIAALDYSYALAAIASLGFYVAARSIGAVAKLAYKAITFQYGSMRQIYNDVKGTYNPLGKVKRPTIIGGTLGMVPV